MAYTHPSKEPIAIIGSGCRFPGNSTSPSKLWQLLHSPRDLSKQIPLESRFNADGFYHPNGERHGSSNVTKSYFIEEDPRLFDASFFSIAPREAEAIDPQQRLLLETVYEAMENGGLTLQGLKGSMTSAYVGAMSADYTDTQTRDVENMSQYMITGTSRALLSNRLSYFFDWHGPSISVDTACSSSLAAVHLGVQSLRNGECTASCAAGSNLILGPDAYLASTSLHLLSASGKSQMWDVGADGYARGEGICAFFMKTLSQALRDGDRIDGIIRETCINSDGRTKGIALPSAEAQATLISTAYKNAGLDILRGEDRPQYIEAHGTGTQAGDPREASALSQTFFPAGHNHDEKPPLVVGSIKTIIGHTEGTAGIAGMLKTLLAMQHKTIPPNQHLHNLNPSVRPFYKKLQIPTTPQEWPTVPSKQPLRASVNGFGSGGTNCHAIMESYVPEVHDHSPWGRPEAVCETQPYVVPDVDFTPTPLVFSASSESALVAMLEKYANHLETADVSIQRLAMTLSIHRSTLPVRIAITGGSKRDVLVAINKELAKVRESPNTTIGTRPPVIEFDADRKPRILGVFTGQGAQWPGMGQALMERCALFRETMEVMEQALAQLPDPPKWSLKDELMASPDKSRLSEAELSLPICAAVQVGLVRLISEAGITFHSVVGHSGGEIGAAYAVGKISAEDAVKIAYYRGIVCKLAIGPDGNRGTMIAVGFGYDEGLKFCSSARMKGRITVAASNSPRSVTLSGDEDAVLEAKQILDDGDLFNRVLRLDTAYHSSHMLPCAEPYTAQLETCNVQVGKGNGVTAWVSSVYEDSRTITDAQDPDMQGAYWTDNLIGRVLFSQALEAAFDDGRGALDLILEVGPHPALRGPTLETMRTKLGYEVPYSGVLDRKTGDITAFSNALGLVWTHLGTACLNFASYLSTFKGDNRQIYVTPLPDLPTYPWDHKQIMYRESRLNKQVRHRAARPHELLGSRTPDDTDYEPRWRNFLKLEEMPWLRDHCIENQIIVPAATYCVIALEAARTLGRGKQVESIELSNVAILRPIVLDESSGGTETLLSLRSDLDSVKGRTDCIRAEFSLSAGIVEDGHMRTAATGEISISLINKESNPSSVFPIKSEGPQHDQLSVNVNQFYESLSRVGLSYSGAFRAITSLERRMDMASAVVAINEEIGRSTPVHPTWLDACFQTFLAAYAAPRDGELWTAFMPTTIGRMTFSPTSRITESVSVDARLTEFTPGFQATLPTINGDMSIYNSKTGRLEVCIEDFTMSSFLPAGEKDDRTLYLKTVWQQDILSGVAFEKTQCTPSSRELKVIDACEKAIHYYLSQLSMDVSFYELADRTPGLMDLIEKAAARDSSEPTKHELDSIMEDYGESIDLLLVKMIGENLTNHSSVRSEAPASLNELIFRWHNEGIGFSQIHNYMVSAAKQISHQYPRIKILQVGPSSANLVRSVCQELGQALDAYTIVDGSTEAIEEVNTHLSADDLRINTKVFDVENGAGESDDIVPGSFHLVIAHKAFTKRTTALTTIRSLITPGGFLLMMDATGDQLRFPFFLLSAPSPVLEEDGSFEPNLKNDTSKTTHNLLQTTGFSGTDSMALDNFPAKHTFSVILSQALDDRITFLRAPLDHVSHVPMRGKLLILGGHFVKIDNVLRDIRSKIYSVWNGEIVILQSLAYLNNLLLDDVENVLSLTELDCPVLEHLSPAKYENLKLLLERSKITLWVTKGAGSESPYQNGTIGLGRTFQAENPHKCIQFLDFDTIENHGNFIAESFLRLVGGVSIKEDGSKGPLLWNIEPEIAIEKDKVLIPRLLPDEKRNDRINSLRRKVETRALVRAQPITLVCSLRNATEVVYTAEEAVHHRQNLNDQLQGSELISLGALFSFATRRSQLLVLPTNATVVSFNNLNSDGFVPFEVLHEALAHVQNLPLMLTGKPESASVVKASALVTNLENGHGNITVVDWTGDQIITVTQRPIEHSHLFSQHKTYVLVGLSGQIGQSMCRWMVVNGARHIVVTSRNPDKSAPWKDALQKQGADIIVEAADVTNKEQIMELRARILETMPPIGGVANGAMVLSDKVFADMSYNNFQKVLKPKVDGTMNLDEVFSADDLDFFILFSSISAVTGHRSQANYAAANNFMASLASQRRARNLAASVIDIGMVIGIGILQRTEDGDGISAMETTLRKLDYMPVSERDLHHILAEAILVGRSDESPEIVTGLETYKSNSEKSPFWHKNLRFSHLITCADSSQSGRGSGSNVQKTWKEKLADSRGSDDALQVMEEAILTYLASSLKLPLEDIYTDVPIIDFGIDSLVAVEIRNWIFAEVGHDVPVLKILGGSSVKQICTEVVEGLSFEGVQAEPSEAKAQGTPGTVSRDWTKQSTGKAPEVVVDRVSSKSAPADDGSESIASTEQIAHSDSVEDDQTTSSSASAVTVDIVNAKSYRPTTLRTESLSLGQSRLYFLSQYLDDDTALNCTASYALSGSLDIPKFERALNAVTQQHEALRTVFFTSEEDFQPVQGVLERSTFKLRVIDGISNSIDLKREFDKTHKYHYNLEIGDTFIATVVSHSADSHTIIFGYHHIIMDGISWQIFQQDLAKYYNDSNTLRSQPTQYMDFTLKQQHDMSNGVYAERLKFFQDEFSKPLDPLPLFPFAKSSTRKSLRKYTVQNAVAHVNSDVMRALKKANQASRTTSFHFFLSAFQVLLHQLLDTEQMCIGMVDANRSDQSFSNTIGFFLETIPVLFQVDSEQKFGELLQATRTKAYSALAKAGVPTEEIIRACNIPASTTETPLFQVVFNYRMGATRTSPMEDVDMKFLDYADARSPFDLVVSVDELEDGTAMLTFSLQECLYDQEGAELLVNTYTHLLEIFSQDTTRSIGSVPMFPATLVEQAVALGTGSQVSLTPPYTGTLSQIIGTWVDQYPDGIAVKDTNGGVKTYIQLSKRADAISVALLTAGATPSKSICVFLDPGVDTIATILGVLRIGAAYVPLDIHNMNERLVDILRESNSTILLYHAATAERARKLHGISGTVEPISFVSLEDVPQSVEERVRDTSTVDGLAMILYTSGSTGRPKGIPLTNGNIRTTILGVSNWVPLGREVVLQQSGQGFDAAIYQIFIALTNGGTLIMGDNHGDPAELASRMRHEGISCSVFIASEMQSMLKYGYEQLRKCSEWHIAMVAGEAFTTNLLEQFRSLKRNDLRIINAYGPTETSICSSMHELTPTSNTIDSRIPIGRAISNYGTYIVDDRCKPVPIGWPGEIAISGPGVAKGYLGLSQLTESKFTDCLSIKRPSDWNRVYLTGDKGRMLSDGSIVISGRIDGDDQVKIRGMRVQLNDVSRAIVQVSHGNLIDAAVLVRGDDSSKQHLVAYVVFSRTSQIHDKGTYLRQLSQTLPIPLYMRPALITPLDILPMTERGKLDNHKLVTMPLPLGCIEETNQFTEEEVRLREVWRNVLGKTFSATPIHRSSDFFSVGGNSLLLLPLRAEIRRVFGVDLSLPEIFQASTLELLAARLVGTFQDTNIDWENETRVDEQISVSPIGQKALTPNMEGISVLLTGATGFLGGALLRQLVDSPDVSHIYCVALRPNGQGKLRKLIVDSPKILRYAGDLALSNIGMSQVEVDSLFSDVDVIIHNGAEVSHMKNYRTLRAPNFQSTVELARLAIRNQIPFHYISTGGIAKLSGASVHPESSVAIFPPPADGSDGYVASKWASEVFLEKLHRQFGGQIWIHRPSSITGNNVPATDIVHNVMRYSTLLKAVPDLTGSTGAFDFIHVDTVSKDIASHAVTTADQKQGQSDKVLDYIHQSGEKVVPIDQLKEYLEGSEIGSFNVLPLREWVNSALEQGLDEVLGSFLLASNGIINIPLMGKSR